MDTVTQPQDMIESTGLAVQGIHTEENLSLEVASQWRLMWWKFRKHRLAMLGAMVVATYYFVAIFADFFAPVSTGTYLADYAVAPPQTIHFFRDGKLAPYVNGYSFERDPVSFKKIFTLDEEKIVPIGLFVHGGSYKILGLVETDIHLIGPRDAGEPFYLLGADRTGRDVLSRTIFSSRVSLSIGLAGVALTLTLGITLGGISGLVGGFMDNVIQRLIEIALSIPTLPIIISVAALVPIDWSVLRVYFIITILLALTRWVYVGRVVRGKFLALREEDFVISARLDGARPRRLIFRHMLPSFYSHIIASITLEFPIMIVTETALSFLGVGLRPPVVSWGVQLQDAQRINVIASYPWLMVPGIAVIVISLAFNFLGDGLRDAADPY